MTPIKQGRYDYRPASLIHLRQRMQLKQNKMAEFLGVPANTLSRWENGATTPDAESLAAIYSLAKERDVTVEFFQPRKQSSKTKKRRDRVSVMWDLNSMNFSLHQLRDVDAWITDQIRTQFSNPQLEWFKVFTKTGQEASSKVLAELDWGVWEYVKDIEDELVSHAKSDCGQKPKETVFVLVANSDLYADLIDELQEQGVHVFLIIPGTGYNNALVDRVSEKRCTKLPPEMRIYKDWWDDADWWDDD